MVCKGAFRQTTVNFLERLGYGDFVGMIEVTIHDGKLRRWWRTKVAWLKATSRMKLQNLYDLTQYSQNNLVDGLILIIIIHGLYYIWFS